MPVSVFTVNKELRSQKNGGVRTTNTTNIRQSAVRLWATGTIMIGLQYDRLLV
jgi:hypothetical protein